MLAKMIDKIVSLKETKIFEIDGQTYADASLTRIPPHVDRPDCISVSGLDSICKPECWQTDTARRILALEPDVRTACTACALKGLGK